MLSEILKICYITSGINSIEDEQRLFLAVQGGVSSVQLRDKKNNLKVIEKQAKKLKDFLTPLNVPLIINDYVNIAREVDAKGLHLGQNDESPLTARKLLGDDKIIGLSIESINELHTACKLDCINYVGASAVFASKNKPDCQMIWGISGLRELAQLSTHPVVAIGGINAQNIDEVIKNGATGVALISAIDDAVNPFFAARELIKPFG